MQAGFTVGEDRSHKAGNAVGGIRSLCENSGMQIRPATSKQELAQVRELFEEYARELGVDLCFQGFAAELAELPGAYAPPEGGLLIAMEGEEAVGCVALRSLGNGVCEMKRLFVRRAFRGRGLGKLLAEKIIIEAKSAGYHTMKLDTLPALAAATRLYVDLGFIRCEAYYETPLKETIFMALKL